MTTPNSRPMGEQLSDDMLESLGAEDTWEQERVMSEREQQIDIQKARTIRDRKRLAGVMDIHIPEFTIANLADERDALLIAYKEAMEGLAYIYRSINLMAPGNVQIAVVHAQERALAALPEHLKGR